MAAKPRFVDPGDEGGELLLEVQRRDFDWLDSKVSHIYLL